MPSIASLADVIRIQGAYPGLDIQPLNHQQERVAVAVCQGLTVRQAAQSVGMTPAQGKDLDADPSFRVVCDYLREVKYGYANLEVSITRDQLNKMLLEAHRKASNSLEEIAAVRELGKMNDLYLDAAHATSHVTVNVGDITSTKQLERLDDTQLIELAGDECSIIPERAL